MHRAPRLSLFATMLAVTGAAQAACYKPDARSPRAWATQILGTAAIVMDGEVVQAQDASLNRPALVRPLTIYWGSTDGPIAMALPPRTTEFITEQYFGFPDSLGSKRFLILYRGPDGFETSPCSEMIANEPKIRAAIIRRARR